jgi:hypothetical protein
MVSTSMGCENKRISKRSRFTCVKTIRVFDKIGSKGIGLNIENVIVG